jgi:tRNA(fMet)-specific endonuclease VapC
VYILDTNHISILERRNERTKRLISRLDDLPDDDIKVTIISYEEQIRGWTAAIARARQPSAQVPLYARLQAQLLNYCELSVLPFSISAAERFVGLRRMHRRISGPDLKIAAIASEFNAVLLTQNIRDFRHIDHLQVEDWTADP